MPGYIQNPYMPQYGGFQYGNYPMQQNAPYQTPTTYPTFQVANPFASMYTGCCNNNVAI